MVLLQPVSFQLATNTCFLSVKSIPAYSCASTSSCCPIAVQEMVYASCLGGDPDHRVLGKYENEVMSACAIFAVSDDVLSNGTLI